MIYDIEKLVVIKFENKREIELFETVIHLATKGLTNHEVRESCNIGKVDTPNRVILEDFLKKFWYVFNEVGNVTVKRPSIISNKNSQE